MAAYHILIATISSYNTQFHRHFGLKKCLILCTFSYMIFTFGQNGGQFGTMSQYIDLARAKSEAPINKFII